MIHTVAVITSLQSIAPQVWVLGFRAPQIAWVIEPGQFINIKVSDYDVPFLRRPFSVYYVDNDEVQIIFNIVGIGTSILSQKRVGDKLDIIGPLGNPFKTGDDFETGLIVGGGMGVAVLPLLSSVIKKISRKFFIYLGARTSSHLVKRHLNNPLIATDDGSEGYSGTVVDLLRLDIIKNKFIKPKIFACGPNAMLKEISLLAQEFNINCEVSLESSMACGFGICQGCPVEILNSEMKYALICKDGPVFNVNQIRIPSVG